MTDDLDPAAGDLVKTAATAWSAAAWNLPSAATAVSARSLSPQYLPPLRGRLIRGGRLEGPRHPAPYARLKCDIRGHDDWGRPMSGVRFLTVLGLVLVLAISGCTGPTDTADPTGPAGCAVQGSAGQQDVDPKDSPEKPWQRSPGNKVTVNFETVAISDRYRDLVRKAAEIWSKSPCITAVAVNTCPPDTNCVNLREKFASRDRGIDGEFSGTGRGTYRGGGTITLYTGLLDRASDNGALATIVHEMGHALGLVHRKDRNSVMNSITNDNTNPVPDDIDFANLLAIYGTQP